LTTAAESREASGAADKVDGKLIYTIESGNESEKFSVDYSSGVVSVTDSLDFEEKAHHQLTVRATDSVTGGFAETIVLVSKQKNFFSLFYLYKLGCLSLRNLTD